MTYKTVAPFSPSSCAIREFTADGVAVGRCWYTVVDGVCQRHGDVSEAQQLYKDTGQLTDDPRRKRRNA